MELVYALEETPEILRQSVFLVGPTPRSEGVPSWRPEMIEHLKSSGYDGTVFIPEPRDGNWERDYHNQVSWEKRHLDLCDAIIAWVPRDLKDMPAFTTNVEFGRYVNSRKLHYGRPPGSPHTQYLDWLDDLEYDRKPSSSMEELARSVVTALEGRAHKRTGGERFIPVQIWESEMFQQWYQSHLKNGNRLDDATVLWTFYPRSGFLLSFVLKVNIWVAEEQRNKSNEFVFSRRNISSVLPVWKEADNDSILNSKVVLVKEFRSTVHSRDSFVHELPSGSDANKDAERALEVAARELEMETGLKISPHRLAKVSTRQLCATLSTHLSYLFLVELNDNEIRQAEDAARRKDTHGEVGSSECTYVEVRTIGDLLRKDDVDFSTLGMLLEGIARLSGVRK